MFGTYTWAMEAFTTEAQRPRLAPPLTPTPLRVTCYIVESTVNLLYNIGAQLVDSARIYIKLWHILHHILSI
jgi:hypothetical protein